MFDAIQFDSARFDLYSIEGKGMIEGTAYCNNIVCLPSIHCAINSTAFTDYIYCDQALYTKLITDVYSNIIDGYSEIDAMINGDSYLNTIVSISGGNATLECDGYVDYIFAEGFAKFGLNGTVYINPIVLDSALYYPLQYSTLTLVLDDNKLRTVIR